MNNLIIFDYFSREELNYIFNKYSKNKKDNKEILYSMENYIQKNKENTDLCRIDILNQVSNGNGRNILLDLYKKELSSEDLQFDNAFMYFKNNKVIDLTTKEGMKLHVYRNELMRHMAPKDLKTMYKFASCGLFIFEGYTPCHNIVNDDFSHRKDSLKEYAYLLASRQIYRRNKYAPCNNVSFRGGLGTEFQGCQFIYNADNGKLVCDNKNRGTWDFGLFGTPDHFKYDVTPWIEVGNGKNVENDKMFIMSDLDSRNYLKKSVGKKALQEDTNTASKIYSMMYKGISRIFKLNKSTEQYELDMRFIRSAEEIHNEIKETKEQEKLNKIYDFFNSNLYSISLCYDKDYERFKVLRDYVMSPNFLYRLKTKDELNEPLIFNTRFEDESSIMTINNTIFYKSLFKNSVISPNNQFRTENETVLNCFLPKMCVCITDDIAEKYSNDIDYLKEMIYSQVSNEIEEMCGQIFKDRINYDTEKKIVYFDIYLKRKVSRLEAALLRKLT